MARRLAPLLLLAYGVAFALQAFGGGLPAFDDHPGQFFRLWHALERSLPNGAWTADWNPDWWGGYPELQFYPPGFVLVGAGLRLLAFGTLSVETLYRIVCALALLLPAATTYALVARVVEDRWLALPPAFLALTLSAGLRGGIEESLRWGMVTSRLAVGCLPLLVLSLRRWVDAGRAPVWAPVVAAAAILAHPASLPPVATVLAVATLLAFALRPERRTAREALAAAGLAGALTAFWTGPLLVRRAWLVPLAWGDLTPTGLSTETWTRPVLLAVALTAPLAWVVVSLRRRPFDALLATLPVALAGVFALDLLLFRLGWSAIEPARLLDAPVHAALWASGLGLGVLLVRATPRGERGPGRPVIALLGVGLAVLFSGFGAGGRTGEATLTLWPAAAGWPTLDEISREHDLPRLWAALRPGRDRVLFLASSLRLSDQRAWYAPHSHVTSLAPLFTGREIVHGTFTHPSPLAARFYTGAATPPPRLSILAEQLDGKLLLGQPWERLSAESFETFARRLRVATVVVPTGDLARARFLEPRYEPVSAAAGFTVLERRDRAAPPWPRVERITYRRYRVAVSPTGGLWIATGIPAYPLWQVKSARGLLPTRTDPWGLLEFRIPLDIFEAELVYTEGWLEWSSLAVSLVAAVVWLARAWRHRAPGPPAQPPGSPVTVRGQASSRSGPGRRRR